MPNKSTYKRCDHCKKFLVRSAFGQNRKRADGLAATCRKCKSAKEKQYYEKHGDKRRKDSADYRARNPTHFRKYYLQYTHGVTEEQVAEIIARQGGLCAICHIDLTDKKQSIDHSHQTGALRGILCNRCNLGIGNFDDDMKRLWEAIRYLQSYEFAPARTERIKRRIALGTTPEQRRENARKAGLASAAAKLKLVPPIDERDNLRIQITAEQ